MMGLESLVLWLLLYVAGTGELAGRRASRKNWGEDLARAQCFRDLDGG